MGSCSQVVRSNGPDHGVATRLNSLYSIRCRAMFQHDLQLWELGVDLLQRRQEAGFGIHDGDVLLVVAGALAMDVLGISDEVSF